jgi:hypothetical protein
VSPASASSAAASPHPVKQLEYLPKILSGVDVLPSVQQQQQEQQHQSVVHVVSPPPSNLDDDDDDDEAQPTSPADNIQLDEDGHEVLPVVADDDDDEDDDVPSLPVISPASAVAAAAATSRPPPIPIPSAAASASQQKSPPPLPLPSPSSVASKEDQALLEEARAAAAGRRASEEPFEALASPRDGRSVLEVVVKSSGAGGSAEPFLLHRSKIGRLSIIERSDVASSALPGESQSPPPAGSGHHSSSSMSASASAAGGKPVANRLASVPASASHPTAIANVEQAAKMGGSVVTSVVRVQHVTLNPNDASGLGAAALNSVPEEWKEALKKQFGLPPNLQASVKLDRYPARIPTVLVRMHEYLLMARVFETQVGIFRLAPDQSECQRLKDALNADVESIERSATHYSDMGACVANLIKVWFRDLPVALFASIPLHELAPLNPASTDAQLEKIWNTHLKEPQRSIFRWLLDLCCDVTLHSDDNKMTAKNLVSSSAADFAVALPVVFLRC